MSLTATALAAAGLLLLTAAPLAASEVKVHPFASAENYCPDGLSPVYFDGVVSCGRANTAVGYHAMMRHPAPRPRAQRVVPARPARVACPVGDKSCRID